VDRVGDGATRGASRKALTGLSSGAVKTRLRFVLPCLAMLATSGGALAQPSDGEAPAETADSETGDAEPAAPEKDAKSAGTDYGHGGQFGLRAALVAGYRMILRYDDSPRCRDPEPGDDEPTFCGNAAPLALDLALGFAPFDGLEPFLWARFGFASEDESAVSIDPVMYLGAGARIYTMSDSALKVYVEPAVAMGLEDGEGPFGEIDLDTELLFHLAAGPQLDLSESFGIFADGGLTMGILRSINSSFELKLGIQGRL